MISARVPVVSAGLRPVHSAGLRPVVSAGLRPVVSVASPRRAASPVTAVWSLTEPGSTLCCIASPVQEGLDQDGQLVGIGATGSSPPSLAHQESSRSLRGVLPVARSEHRSHIRVAGRTQPQLVLQEHPAPHPLVGALADVVPHRSHWADRLVGHRHLGEQDGQKRLLPPIEKG